MSQSLKLLMLSTYKTPEIKSSNNFIWGCTDKVYNTILYHIYSQTTTGPTFSCARQYQSESLALPWYVLTTALQFSIRTIEYLFYIYYWSHRSLLCQESTTGPTDHYCARSLLLVPQLIVPVGILF